MPEGWGGLCARVTRTRSHLFLGIGDEGGETCVCVMAMTVAVVASDWCVLRRVLLEDLTRHNNSTPQAQAHPKPQPPPQP